MGIFLRYPKRVLDSVPNGLFLRGLPHESTVRGLKGFFWASDIISAQWNKTIVGCLMSPLCDESYVCFGFRIYSRTDEQYPFVSVNLPTFDICFRNVLR